MLKKLLAPHVDLAPLVLRLVLGMMFVSFGYVKIVQDNSWLNEAVLSPALQRVVGWTEFLCGLALLIGLFSRVAALGIIVLMVGAIVTVTGDRGLVPVEFGPGHQGVDFNKVGPTLNVAVIGMCLALILLGSGMVSLDYLLLRALHRGGKTAAATTTSQTAAAAAPPSPPATAPAPAPLPERLVSG
jgi:putative oxidoreductase